MYDVPGWKKELKRRLDAMRSRKAVKKLRTRKEAEAKTTKTAEAST